MQNQPRPTKLPKPWEEQKKCEWNWIRAILQNGWMKQMSKSYLERTTGRNRRNKKIYWTSSFMALPSMSQSHIKRDIICDDEMFEIQYVVIKGKNKKCIGRHPSMSSLYRQSAPSLSVAITFPRDFFLFGTRQHLWKLQTNALHWFWGSRQLLLCRFGPQRRWGVPSQSSTLLL